MRRASLRRTLLIDIAIAAALAGVVLIVAPGLAVVGMLALLVLVLGTMAFVIDLREARRGPRAVVRGETLRSGSETVARRRRGAGSGSSRNTLR
jgi:hypothetical protein